MLYKPSIWDYKYDKMSAEETRLNYDRDVMLYEQTIALQKLNEQINPTSSDPLRPILTPDDIDDITVCRKFAEGTKEYEHYEDLREQRLELLDKAKNSHSNLLALTFYSVISNIVFMPISLCVNMEMFTIQAIILVIQLFIVGLILSDKHSYKVQADKLLKERKEYVKECKRAEKKAKELEQQRIIENTEHLECELED